MTSFKSKFSGDNLFHHLKSCSASFPVGLSPQSSFKFVSLCINYIAMVGTFDYHPFASASVHLSSQTVVLICVHISEFVCDEPNAFCLLACLANYQVVNVQMLHLVIETFQIERQRCKVYLRCAFVLCAVLYGWHCAH